jgi:uncharacterized protein DUF4114
MMGIKKNITAGLGALALSLSIAGSASAGLVVFGDGGSALQGVLDNITTNPVGASSINVNTDQIQPDEYWAVTGAGGSISTMIIELAGFAPNNVFGVYDRTNPGNRVTLFGGAAVAGSQVALGIAADGSVLVNFADTGSDFAANNFGFFLDSSANGGGGLFFSDETLNGDGVDHLAVYQGNNSDIVQLPGLAPGLWTDNEFILAWEDLVCPSCDADYTDMVLMIESVTSTVPAPAALGFLGFGLLGMGIARRRKA